MWNFYNEQLEVSRKDAKDVKVNVLGTEKIWRGLGLGRRAGIASRQASRNSELIWAGIPYCVLHTCLGVCRSDGAWWTITLKWIVDTKYKTIEK